MSNLKKKVLVVDDQSTMRKIVRTLLAQIGFTDIEEAADGGAALDKLKHGSFGLVMSDWNMAPVTGLQLLQSMRADDACKSTPFIMVTAEGRPENVMAAKEAGVSNYIVKPFSADILKKKVEAVLGPLA